MIIDLKCGMVESMFSHYTQERIDKMVRERFATEIAHKILNSDIFEIKSRFTNNEDASEGVEYYFTCALFNESDMKRFQKELKMKK